LELQENTRQRQQRLWLDESLLPTTLARKRLASTAHAREINRLMKIADLVLDNPEDISVVERR
jgi:hypothetical protein